LGIEALTITDSGETIVPQTKEDWTDWVSATETRNYVSDDPLIDWLNLYGKERGFISDLDLPGYDSRTDFSRFVTKKGIEFEDEVVKHLQKLIPIYNITTNPMRSLSLEAAEQTVEAMFRGELTISQAVIRDAESRTFGLADLLVRGDKLAEGVWLSLSYRY